MTADAVTATAIFLRCGSWGANGCERMTDLAAGAAGARLLLNASMRAETTGMRVSPLNPNRTLVFCILIDRNSFEDT